MHQLTYKSVDIMKKCKDTVNAQLTASDKNELIATIKTIGVTHIAISVPMDTNGQMIAEGNSPSPRTIEAETQDWCDRIHDAGLKVIHRGTFCGMEAIYDFPYYKDGSGDYINPGTSSSAATDGETTWMGRIRRYILTNVGSGRWVSGDIFSPVPEPTSVAFNGNQFWDNDGDGSQTNFASFFSEAKATSDGIFSGLNISVPFISFNNFSEVRSGWIPGSLFSNQSFAGFDYYGQYQASGANRVDDYKTDLNAVYNAKSQPMFFGEWGDIAGEALPTPATIKDRLHYLVQFYKMLRDNFAANNKLIGFNYWGGWEDQNTSILYKSSTKYYLNARGRILQMAFKNALPDRIPITDASDNY